MGEGESSRGDQGRGGADRHTSSAPTSSGISTLLHSGSVALPERIGRYRILGVLGEGGFGVVYQAQQDEPIRRRVALKILKPGMDSAQVLARFQAEQQALALMDHPNVARVFDGGVTESGRAYFAMEYVSGVPITDYCDRNRLSTAARIELFIQVCQAIQHAHTKGVIHRDLKPSNVLVEVSDTRPVPKVIDFGVAKAVNRSLTDRTLHTELGQLIGTPEYMSPEQAEMSGLDIDTRTDIYSLGVLLYELLTGALPFDPRSLRAKGYAEIQRIIREAEPPKPSTRLSSLLADEASARATAQKRQTDLRELVRTLRGDIDWITMKAMEKDRTRRYETAAQFAADLRRHLSNEPVEARPPSVMYLTRKFVRRHRWPIATAALILLTMIGGLIASSVLYVRAEDAREKEKAANAKLAIERDAAVEAKREAVDARLRAEQQAYIATIAVADAAIAAGDFGAARARLALAPESRRNWEWRILLAATDYSSATIPIPEGHACLVMAADGRFLYAGLLDGATLIIDVAKGQVVASTPPGQRPVVAIAAAPDQRTVYVAHDDGSITARDGASLRTLRPIRAPQDILTQFKSRTEAAKARKTQEYAAAGIGAMGVSPDGSLLAIGCGDGACRVVFTADGREKVTLQTSSLMREGVRHVAFSHDSKRLVTVSDLATQTWSIDDARAVGSVPAFMPSAGEGLLPGFGVDLTPDGAAVAVMNPLTSLLQVWHTLDNQRTMVLGSLATRGDLAGVAIRLSHDAQRIAVGFNDGTIQVWDITPAPAPDDPPRPDRERLRAVLPGHRAAITAMAFSPDRSTMASASRDGAIRIWKPGRSGSETAISRQTPPGDAPPVISDDGSFMAFADGAGLKIWDLRTMAPKAEAANAAPALRIRFDSGGLLLLVDESGGVRDLAGIQVKPVPASTDAARRGLTLPIGHRVTRRLRPDQPGNSIEVWDTAHATLYASLSLSQPVLQSKGAAPLFVARDGGAAAVFTRPNLAECFILPSGKRVASISSAVSFQTASFAADGSFAAILDTARSLVIQPMQQGVQGRRVQLSSSPIAADFNPDASRLAVLLADGSIRLLETESGTEILVLRAATSARLATVSFSPDGSLLMAAGELDIHLWRAH